MKRLATTRRGIAMLSALFLLLPFSNFAAAEESSSATSVSTSATEGTGHEEKGTSGTTKEDKDFVGTFMPSEGEDKEGRRVYRAVDFSLRDQNGKRHKLKEYEGKVVVLNFWQTWCGPCLDEMPEFELLYQEYGKGEKDVIILGVSTPKNPLNTTYTQEQSSDQEIKKKLEEKNINYPCLMDYEAKLYSEYMIPAFPTTLIILPDGHIFGALQGSVEAEQLRKLIDEAREKKKVTAVAKSSGSGEATSSSAP